MIQLVIIAIVLIASASPAHAQTVPKTDAENAELKKTYLYQWTDDAGGSHITDGLDKVPKQYREKAIKLEQPKEESGGAGRKVKRVSPYAGHSEAEGIESDQKAEWQLRLKEARSRLADAEQQYRELDKKRLEALGKGGIATGHREGPMEAERIEQEMKQVEQEIDAARQQLEVIIPEEARKAGVPPGWLRE